MKYAEAYEGFILFHILPIGQNISQSEGLFHIAKQYFIKYAIILNKQFTNMVCCYFSFYCHFYIFAV